MKRVFRLFYIPAVIALLFTSCQKEKEEATQKIKTAEEFEVVENENKPQGPPVLLKFVEDLSITEEGWWPRNIMVNEKYIYVLIGKEYQLIKYDHDGIEVSRKIFREGQGPGEFQIMDPCLSSDGSLFIADFSQHRLTVMDKEYKIQKISKLDLYGMAFRLDPKGNLYFLTIKYLPEQPSQNKVVLAKYAPSGSTLYEIDEYIWGPTYNTIKGKYLDELFRPQLKYKIDSHDNIYYAMTDKYEINKVSSEGELIRKIKKKGQTRKVTQEDIDKAMPSPSGASRVKYEYNIPAHMPCIADLFILDNGYLLVVTFENDIGDSTLGGDLFDDKGIYSARIQIPKYYRWDYLLMPSKNYAISSKNYFYTLEASEDEKDFYVKRYKMIWNKQS